MENPAGQRLNHAVYITDTGSVLVQTEPAEDYADLDVPVTHVELSAHYAALVADLDLNRR